MKLTNKIMAGIAGLTLLSTATGYRVHSRINSKPSQEVEQQLSQNPDYVEIISQIQNPWKREAMGLYIDFILPLRLKFDRTISSKVKEDIRASRHDPKTGKHRQYNQTEKAVLYHIGADSNHPNMGQYHVLNSIEGSYFRKP